MGPSQPRWRGCQRQPRSRHWQIRRCGGTTDVITDALDRLRALPNPG